LLQVVVPSMPAESNHCSAAWFSILKIETQFQSPVSAFAFAWDRLSKKDVQYVRARIVVRTNRSKSRFDVHLNVLAFA
jgi:hypothetical protein